jgi:hypothetical protein
LEAIERARQGRRVVGFRKGGEALLRGISLNPCFHELVYSPAYLPLIHYVSILYPPNILRHQDQGKVGFPLGYLVAAIGGNVGGTVAGLVGPLVWVLVTGGVVGSATGVLLLEIAAGAVEAALVLTANIAAITAAIPTQQAGLISILAV